MSDLEDVHIPIEILKSNPEVKKCYFELKNKMQGTHLVIKNQFFPKQFFYLLQEASFQGYKELIFRNVPFKKSTREQWKEEFDKLSDDFKAHISIEQVVFQYHNENCPPMYEYILKTA